MRLPNSVKQIADVIGREATLLLIGQLPKSYSADKRYPGAKNSTLIMYVPTLGRLPADHQLVRMIGWNAAVKLCKAFGGEIMYPASCMDVYRASRDTGILSIIRQGVKYSVIAEWFGVSERHVRNVAQENPPEEVKRAANDNRQTQQQLATA